jgi:hypothetical protein
MWHENDDGSLETTFCFMDVLHSSHHYVWKYVATHSLPRNFLFGHIQKYMNKTRHVTYELPCTHDKRNQITRQKRVFVLVVSEARWQFFTLRHTLQACTYVKHECLWSRISIDVVPALIFSQILVFPSSSVSNCTPSFLRFHCVRTNSIQMFLWKHLKKDVYSWELF